MSGNKCKIQNSHKPVFFIISLFLAIACHYGAYAQSAWDLIFVQIQADSIPPDPASKTTTVLDRYRLRSRIVSLTAKTPEAINLTQEFYAACDPDISFDGRRILFAAKVNREDSWQLWTMNYDGSEKKRITAQACDCIMPVYAGKRFYLDDPQPTPQIIFTGIVDGSLSSPAAQPVSALYGIDMSGQSIHRLTFNLYSDFSPDMLFNGQIVFSSWQPSDGGRQALLAINIDGTDLMAYYGNHEAPLYKEMAHISDNDSRVFYIETDTLYWLGGGNIAAISQKRPLHSHRTIATADSGIYSSPCPLPDGGLIASYRLKNKGEFALYHIDPVDGTRRNLICKKTGWHCLDTQVLAAHPNVKGRSNWLKPGSVTGIFYCLNVYRSSLYEKKEPEEEDIHYVRIIEGLPSADSKSELPAPSVSAHKSGDRFMACRLLGTVPVEKDGSFQVKVPAEIPINFQLLNKDYMMVRQQKGWTWVIGNENRGCIGCHEDPELSPKNVLVDAVTKPAVDLTNPLNKNHTVDFLHKIAPILNKKCAVEGCHVTGKIKPDFEFMANRQPESNAGEIYRGLLEVDYTGGKSAYIVPGYALKSRLTGILMGNAQGIPEELKSENGKITHRQLLDKRERKILVEWIDLGAQWDLSAYEKTYPRNKN